MLPNVIIIGAMKSGTTSLHYYLNQHPAISMSDEKELDYFVAERNWNRGIGWYESNFTTRAHIHGESSPGYTQYPLYAGVAARMSSVVPHAKLIYIVRDPIERIVSHYLHAYADGTESRAFAEALSNLQGNEYVYTSRYFMQLEQYLAYYPKERILIITQENLLRRQRQTLQEAFAFLEVDPSFCSRRFEVIKHQSVEKRRKGRLGMLLSRVPGMGLIERLPSNLGGRNIREGARRLLFIPFSRKVERPVLDEGLRRRLMSVLSEDVNRLRMCTGKEFKEWSL
jgi:hypothetical protein